MPHLDLEAKNNTTFSLLFKAKDCEGAGINLSGYSINSYIKEKYSASTGIASFTSTITVPQSGICSISLSSLETSGLAPNVYIYNITCNNTTITDVFSILEGHLLINP